MNTVFLKGLGVLLMACGIWQSSYAQSCLETLVQLDEDRFEELEKGLVYDSDTGLMWFRCTYGQSWVNDECTGTEDLLTLDQGLEIAEDLVYGGYPDWKVPNINELQSIADFSCYQPAISADLFPGVLSAHYLSSSVFVNESSAVVSMNVDFYNGRAITMTQDFAYLMLVRQQEEE